MAIRNRMEKVSKKKKKAITPFRAGMLLQGANIYHQYFTAGKEKSQQVEES